MGPEGSSVLKQQTEVLDETRPLINVRKPTDLTTRIVVRTWAQRDDSWEVCWDLTRKVEARLAAEGLRVDYVWHSMQRLQEISQ